MIELRNVFDNLVQASKDGKFEEALVASPLGAAALRLHPLGFTSSKITMGKHNLRLHIWRNTGSPQAGFEVHDHTFDFESYVISGSIKQTVYDIHANNDGNFCIYHVDYDENTSILKNSGNFVNLVQLKEEIVSANQSYRVRAGELHRSDLFECSCAVTLVLTEDRGGTPITIGPRNGPPRLVFDRTELPGPPLANGGLGRLLKFSGT
jgi:hypothetical protein